MKKRNHSSVAYLNASFTQKLMKEQKKHYECIFCEDSVSKQTCIHCNNFLIEKCNLTKHFK